MSRTSSIRLSEKLFERLDRASERSQRGRNTLIVEAIEEYLGRLERSTLEQEARRQSLLASRTEADDEAWLEAADLKDWK